MVVRIGFLVGEGVGLGCDRAGKISNNDWGQDYPPIRPFRCGDGDPPPIAPSLSWSPQRRRLPPTAAQSVMVSPPHCFPP